MKTLFTFVFRLLALLLFISPLQAETTQQVKMPNGEYTESSDDLSVKIRGGYVVAKRVWQNGRWYLTPSWADLKFTFDALDGSVKAIDRAGTMYERSGEAWYFGKNHYIQKTAEGYRWNHRQGEWTTYDENGRIIAYGDRNGAQANFTHNSQGQRTAIHDAQNNVALTFTYNGAGLLESVKDRTGREVRYTYTGERLTQVTDVLGNPWKYEYDSQGQIKSRTDPENRKIDIFYVEPNPAGKLEGTGFKASGPINRTPPSVVTTGATPRDFRIAEVGSYTDAENNTTTYQYQYNRNTRKYTVTAITPTGRKNINVYDKNGFEISSQVGNIQNKVVTREGDNVEAITDTRGNVTRIYYNANREVLKAVHPDGSSISNTWNSYGQLLTYTSELSIVTKYDYDTKGNLVRTTEAVGLPEQRITEATWDSHGQKLTETIKGETTDQDAVTAFVYDNYGNIQTLTDAENHKIEYTYDVMGNTLTEKNARGVITEYEYDARGGLLRITEAKGTIEERSRALTYDKVGNKVTEANFLGNTTTNVYNKRNQLIQVIDSLGGTVKVEYDEDGKPTKRVDEDGVVLEVDYDASNRPVEERYASGDKIQTIYGEANSGLHGLIVATQYPTYREEYRYDPRNRIVQTIKILDAQTRETTQTEYDAAGNPIKGIDPMGRVTQRIYNALQQETSVTDALNGARHFKYNAHGQLLISQ